MTQNHHRDHLDHLPGRSYLTALAAVAALSVVFSVIQLASSDRTIDTVLWGIVVALGAISLLAIGIAWEERRAHVHAVVREALEGESLPPGVDPIAELLRMGAHREAEYVRSRTDQAAASGSS